jgi:large subunit ribosomal protein L26e
MAEAAVAKMKSNPFVASDKNKNHKRHSNASTHICRKTVPSLLFKELRQKYNVLSTLI